MLRRSLPTVPPWLALLVASSAAFLALRPALVAVAVVLAATPQVPEAARPPLLLRGAGG